MLYRDVYKKAHKVVRGGLLSGWILTRSIVLCPPASELNSFWITEHPVIADTYRAFDHAGPVWAPCVHRERRCRAPSTGQTPKKPEGFKAEMVPVSVFHSQPCRRKPRPYLLGQRWSWAFKEAYRPIWGLRLFLGEASNVGELGAEE